LTLIMVLLLELRVFRSKCRNTKHGLKMGLISVHVFECISLFVG